MCRSSAASPKQEILIRKGRSGDAEVLHPLIHAAYRTSQSWTTEVDLVRGERITLPQLREQLSQAVDPIFVAEIAGGTEAGRVVGCVCAEWAKNHPDTGLGPESALFGLLAVDPDKQSAGIGSELFLHALKFAKKEWGCLRAVLWVIKQRGDILAWYERLGFQWTGELKDFVFPDLAMHREVEFKVLVKSL
jgi:GNAT superfamily N-acetyltransferase